MLKKIQEEQKEWARKNFPNSDDRDSVLGMQEELGELSHSVLKQRQGIRLHENHEAKISDAIGDLILFILDFCNKRNLDAQDTLVKVWDEVKMRDWTQNKNDGKTKLINAINSEDYAITGEYRQPTIGESYLDKYSGIPKIVYTELDKPLDEHFIINWLR